jgi:hypothetical protein
MPYYGLFFLCFIIFFTGYIVVHKAVSCEWL